MLGGLALRFVIVYAGQVSHWPRRLLIGGSMASVTHGRRPRGRGRERPRGPAPYMNPYLAGIGLGLVLLAAFVLVGRGLGASGAFNSAIAWLVSLVAPGYARSNEFLADYLERAATHPLKAWLVFEVAGRLRRRAPLGPARRPRRGGRSRRARASRSRARLAFAFVGGAPDGDRRRARAAAARAARP